MSTIALDLTPAEDTPDPYPMTLERQTIALQYCATEDLGAIARRCFGEMDADGKRIDGRSLAAKAVKMFLAGEGKAAKPAVYGDPLVPDAPLSDAQKRMIEELSPKMREGGSLELARLVWNDQTIGPLSKKARVVREHMKVP
jgi:hypothetical protein